MHKDLEPVLAEHLPHLKQPEHDRARPLEQSTDYSHRRGAQSKRMMDSDQQTNRALKGAWDAGAV
jgi:hypothetical protein